MYALEPTEKLEVLVGLCHRLMTTYSAQDFMTSRQQASIELWLVVVSYSGSVAREVIYFGELGAALNHCFTAAPKIGRLVASGCLTRDKLGKMWYTKYMLLLFDWGRNNHMFAAPPPKKILWPPFFVYSDAFVAYLWLWIP